ncbi:hypothetical protein, partial [Botryobacter ruber]|uniref:hypothetical protein n=1 Tax=Botryobacter ruber TaxID=2171629 RepID=UPI00196A3EB4
MLKQTLTLVLALFAFLQVSAQTVSVTSPNGGQTFYSGKNYNITWSSSGASSFVKLEFSTDNGSNWSLIADGINNNGSYSWLIPDNASENCLVRVSDFSNSAISDVSDATFTIKQPFITITSPNGGETFEGCSQQTITWISGGVNSYAKILYSTDGGLIWTPITDIYVGSGGNHSYNWSVPTYNTGNFKIRIVDYYDESISDVTDAVFSVTRPASYLTLTSPNGGESWSSSSVKTITWTTTGTVGNVSLKYSTDNGASWDWIRNSEGAAANNIPNTGSYQWLLPGSQAATSCLVQIYEYAKSCTIDMSNSLFLIDNNPAITVTAPDGGERWFVDRNYTIRWSASNLPSNYVAIDYSTDNGATWNEITSSQGNYGSYNWTIPDNVSSQCLVRVKARDNAAISDISGTNFSILQPFIRLTSPNGGEVIAGCSNYEVAWQQEGIQDYVRILYSVNGGNNWTYLTDVYTGSGTSGSYNWTVPAVATDKFRVKVQSYYNAAVNDSSDANFTVS